MERIIVVEYPKSGGTWITSLIGDALGWPKRDIYVDEHYKAFDVRKHPWYRGGQTLALPPTCVIKSHELPRSKMHNFPAQLVHLVRDGRDVLVSKYIYESEFCVRNGIYESFDVPFDVYLRKEAKKWRDFVLAWLNEPAAIQVRYEDFLSSPAGELQRVLHLLGRSVSEQAIARAVQQNTKARWRQALAQVFAYNTFVRKGEAGNWREYLTAEQERTFREIAGDALQQFGYL